MNYSEFPPEETWEELLKRPSAEDMSVEQDVLPILHEVKKRGDAALLEFTERFDGVKLDTILVSEEEIAASEAATSFELREAILLAKNNIEWFHNAQHIGVMKVETMPGVNCWRKSVPVERVGLYIPGGSAPLFSTILMLAIPAKLAGCKEIILCTPPSKDGSVHPAILYAAKVCGVTRIFKAGGAQAIAAMAYGTETIPRAYKIFGPGNPWVTAAKQMLTREGIAIDLPAGPSELAVFADASVSPAFIAADLLSQAEHGPDSQVLLVSCSRALIDYVRIELQKQLEELPRKLIAEKAIRHSHFILMKDEDSAMQLLNAYAPEHLILACENAELLAEKVVNAGSVFLGAWSPESVGDYASGTNHTLPTNGFAKAWSGVSLDSFMKKITFQQLTEDGLRRIGPSVETMAEAEGLFAHKNAVSIRLKK